MTTSGAFIPEIDGLRFIAIGLVVLFHLAVNLQIKNPARYTAPQGDLLGSFAHVGSHGVELFFIISGFVLAIPFARHHLQGAGRVSLRQYFLRRVTRLEPPYLISMILVFAVLVGLRGRDPGELLPHLGASMGYVHNVLYGEESLVNNVAWSLEIEIQFYLLVPLLTALFTVRDRRRRRAAIVAAIVVAFVVAQTIGNAGARERLSILHFLHFFLLGFLLVDVYLESWRGRPTRSARWDGIALVAWPCLVFTLTRVGGQGVSAWIAGAAFTALAFVVSVAAFRGRVANRVATVPWLTAIGGMCYTIYLLHNPILNSALAVSARLAPAGVYALDLVFQALVMTPLVLLPCVVFFLAIEKPCMRRDWPQRLWARVMAAGRRSS